MSKNIIYYFTGTGNSLKVAKDIATSIGDCDVVSMGVSTKHDFNKTYENIGFVFPVYGMGIPFQVKSFIKNMDLNKSKNAYYFSIATCGGSAGSSIGQINKLLLKKGVKLNYGMSLLMASNYVVLYKMQDNSEQINEESNKKLLSITYEIKNKTNKLEISNNFLFSLTNSLLNKSFKQKDKGFNVSDACINCGICMKVCPMKNINMDNKKPKFNHNCSQCMACIQWCPKQAINYKDITQDRGRYHNPDIKWEELKNVK